MGLAEENEEELLFMIVEMLQADRKYANGISICSLHIVNHPSFSENIL
jgi:hypothetical protein